MSHTGTSAVPQNPGCSSTLKDSGPKSCQYLCQDVSALFLSVFPSWLLVTLICVATKLPPPLPPGVHPSLCLGGVYFVMLRERRIQSRTSSGGQVNGRLTYYWLWSTKFRLRGPTSVNIILTASSRPLVAPVPEFLT